MSTYYYCKPGYCEEIAAQAKTINSLQMRLVTDGEVFEFNG